METNPVRKDASARVASLLGTVLLWLPLLAPLILSVDHYLRSGRLLVDYLMPAELFGAVLVGCALLYLAAWRAKSPLLKWIAWLFLAAVVFLFGCQGLAVLTGLASGATAPGGWQQTLVTTLLAVYIISILALAILGIRLVREIFKRI